MANPNLTTDARLRSLERQAQAGDAEALQILRLERARHRPEQRWTDVRLAWVDRVAIENAILTDHDCTGDYSCDIAAALRAGFQEVAAHLLMGAADCPTLERCLQTLDASLTAGHAFPRAWGEWTEWHEEHGVRCSDCGAYSFEDETTLGACGNCRIPFNELRLPDGMIRVVDTAEVNSSGAAVFEWAVTTEAGDEWRAANLLGPRMGPEPTEREMLDTLLAFLEAALESRRYREETGRPGENEDLFPAELLDWADQYSDAIAAARWES